MLVANDGEGADGSVGSWLLLQRIMGWNIRCSGTVLADFKLLFLMNSQAISEPILFLRFLQMFIFLKRVLSQVPNLNFKAS